MKKVFRKKSVSRGLRSASVAFCSFLLLASAAFAQAAGQSPSREAVRGTRGQSPARETRHQEQDRNPDRPIHLDRDSQSQRDPLPEEARSPGSSRVLYERDRAHKLCSSQMHTLSNLAKFRVIATDDLAKHSYRADREGMQQDVRKLIRQRLLRRGTFEGPDANPRELLTLTKNGHRLMRANRLVPEGQSTYHGFVKPKEANHDADLYRLYQKEAGKILEKGGRNLRVVLDYELKKTLNQDFARFGSESRPEIAARHGLQVVGNKILVPDLRIEYETREGDMGRVDLELTTEHYRPRQIAEKERAGFSLYASPSDTDRVCRVLDQHVLTAEILTL